MSLLYYSSKANVVADTFSKIPLESVAHVEDGKELVRYVHRLAQLGVRLTNSTNGRMIVQKCSE